MKFGYFLSLVASVLFLGACGSSVCAGSNCTCPASETCAFDSCSASTASCNYQCGSGSTCTGTCGPSCRVQCDGAQCTHTVGAGSTVQCNRGTCNITCNGTCTATSLGGTGTLNLTCNGSTQSPAGCL